MAITATYINESQFSVATDYREWIRNGTVVVLNMGSDGNLETYVSACEYIIGDDLTIYTIESSALTANLAEITHGWTFVDVVNLSSNLAKHDHSADYQGGEQAFSGFTSLSKVSLLNALAAISSAVRDTSVGVNHAGTGFVKRTFTGTENQIDVTVTDTDVLFEIPQDIATTSNVEFAGVRLTNNVGVVVADAEGDLAGLDSTTPKALLRVNSAGTAYEFAVPTLFDLGDVAVATPEHGQGIYWDSYLNKWRVRTGEGGGPVPDGVSLGTVLALIDAMS